MYMYGYSYSATVCHAKVYNRPALDQASRVASHSLWIIRLHRAVLPEGGDTVHQQGRKNVIVTHTTARLSHTLA